MIRIALFLFAALAAVPLSAQGVCSSKYGTGAMNSIQQHFANLQPRHLFTTQLHLNVGFQHGLTSDGKWGPATRTALCQALGLYTDIGGRIPGWTSDNLGEAQNFVQWLEAAAYANSNPGAEFPD